MQGAPAAAASAKTRLIYALGWASVFTILIAGPWIAAGYLFGTDWPGPRRFLLPTEFSSAAPVEIGLAVLSSVTSGELAGKVFVFGCLFGSALGSYLATPSKAVVPRIAASILFTANPFVYGRLHYGQLFLVAGYAVLPWFAISLRGLVNGPGLRAALLTACAAAAVGAFSPHLFVMTALVSAIFAAVHVTAHRRLAALATKTGPWLLLSAALALVISSYWIVPLVAGHGSEGSIIAATGPGQLAAYAAIPDQTFGLVPNLLGLYGFWAEGVGRFLQMKSFLPFWPLVLVGVLAVCSIGLVSGLRNNRAGERTWVIALVGAGAVALFLEMGVSSPISAGVVTWLDGHLPLYRGLRDAGKWAALLALVYSQLFGLGAATILEWVGSSLRSPIQKEWTGAVLGALLLALPLAYGNGLLFGSHGEIKASEYPSGWYAADRILVADPNHGRVLILPWHEYMRYSFIKNQNSVVASPAPSFFSVPVLTSQDPEVSGIAPPETPDQQTVRGLVAQGSSGDWASTLAKLGVRYVLVDKDLDWQAYSYLDSQPGLTKVADLGSILLYRNGDHAQAATLKSNSLAFN